MNSTSGDIIPFKGISYCDQCGAAYIKQDSGNLEGKHYHDYACAIKGQPEYTARGLYTGSTRKD